MSRLEKAVYGGTAIVALILFVAYVWHGTDSLLLACVCGLAAGVGAVAAWKTCDSLLNRKEAGGEGAP
jgi:hypothetical protein